MDPAIEQPPHRFRSASLLALDIRHFVHQAFPENATNPKARAYRLLEEALEMTQSLGVTQEEAQVLVDFVFSRPAGEVAQEFGGVVMTTIALGNSLGSDVISAGYDALTDARARLPTILLKASDKPTVS